MAEQQVTLTGDECQCLVELLETTLKDVRVEEHRTRTPSYREFVLHREKLIQEMLKKLRDKPA
jgi:hypothetical protein